MAILNLARASLVQYNMSPKWNLLLTQNEPERAQSARLRGNP